jgi:hypothetical protein
MASKPACYVCEGEGVVSLAVKHKTARHRDIPAAQSYTRSTAEHNIKTLVTVS